MTSFAPASAGDRALATDFVGRVAQLDPAGLVRLVADGEHIDLWARAGFGVIAVRRVAGEIEPDPLTVYATNLVAALAVSRAAAVDPGTEAGDQWHAQLPPADGWTTVGALPMDEVINQVRTARPVAEQAVRIDRADELRARTKATVPPAILDRALLTVPAADHLIPISMRMLFALSGMGFAPAGDAPVTVRATATWLRLDTPSGGVARRRMADLPMR
jgi:hypothetical protein